MKHVMIVALALNAGVAQAEEINATISHYYRTETVTKEAITKQCELVRVPNSTNANGNFNTGGAVVGGVIGGLLGNQVGGGSGREVATGVGAIVGAIVGGQSGQQIQNSTGYRTEERCANVSTPVSEVRQIYSHSSITFIDNGTMVTLNYQR